MNNLTKESKIFIAGHNGMVGSAIMRKYLNQGFNNIVTKTSKELDLRNQVEVNSFFDIEKPDYVIIAAAKVGGIYANDIYKADFIYENLMIACNLINSAHENNINDLCFLGSSCIYPRASKQPIR